MGRSLASTVSLCLRGRQRERLHLDLQLDDETIRAYIADPFWPLNLRLSQGAAWNLVEAVRPVAEWRAEGEAARADGAAGRLSCGHDGWVEGCEVCEREEDLVSERIERIDMLYEAADLERKRRKENPR